MRQLDVMLPHNDRGDGDIGCGERRRLKGRQCVETGEQDGSSGKTPGERDSHGGAEQEQRLSLLLRIQPMTPQGPWFLEEHCPASS